MASLLRFPVKIPALVASQQNGELSCSVNDLLPILWRYLLEEK